MFDYGSYLRQEMLPHIWCKGCGDGIVLKALLRAIHRLGLSKDRVAIVSGIGCSSRLSGYVDCNTLHSTHGRPLAFATGLKLARPELTVIVITGDGDGLAIGGNHLIHAARRNIDLTCLLFNNQIYGMTGGQVAPTTPEALVSTTTPYGNIEPAFDACRLVEAAGATFVGRGTAYRTIPLEKMIAEGIQHRGFAFIEVLTTCPEIHGRRNHLGTPAEMLQALGKVSLPTGILHRSSRPEYGEAYGGIIARAQGTAG
ncbi:MAG TPA: 2-oxoacid:ferredoxin oxidoreductase subunit beta [Candidatus Methylomirabilis sp.]|nr:2-oxoacid:ferredoxin oxidoreductase subunit beta [Candidatus Methylomirabilis sp.]